MITSTFNCHLSIDKVGMTSVQEYSEDTTSSPSITSSHLNSNIPSPTAGTARGSITHGKEMVSISDFKFDAHIQLAVRSLKVVLCYFF